MNVKPLESILIREIQSEEAKYLSFLADGIDQAVNIGTYFIKWEAETGGATIEKTPLIMFYRHMLEMVDAVSILIRSSSSDPCKAILRSVLETSLQIEYLLKDPEKMGYCYMICYHNKMIKQLKRMVNKSPEQKNFFNQLKNKSFSSINENDFSHPNAENEVKRLTMLINSLYYKIYQEEYIRITTQKDATGTKDKNPEWYSLFKGPKSLVELAAELQKKDLYEFMYRPYSSTVHGSDLLNSNLEVQSNGYAKAYPIRNNGHLSTISEVAIQLLTETQMHLINRFDESKKQYYFHWYSSFRNQYLNKISSDNAFI